MGYEVTMPDGAVFSDELEAWLRSDEPKTLGALNDIFDERSFAVAITLLMFPSALPIPTGGVTHVLEVVTLLLAGADDRGARGDLAAEAVVASASSAPR